MQGLLATLRDHYMLWSVENVVLPTQSPVGRLRPRTLGPQAPFGPAFRPRTPASAFSLGPAVE